MQTRVISIHEILNINESTILKFNYILQFIHAHLYVEATMSMCTIFTSNLYHWKYVEIVVVAFTKKKKKKKKLEKSKEDRTASRANTQPFSEYFSVHM